MRDQIETLRLRGAVPGEVNDDCVFRLGAFQSIEWTGFQTRWSSFARESLNRSENVGLGCVLVQQLNHFNAFETRELSLAPAHFIAKTLRIGFRVFQVVLRILILVHTDGDDVSRAFAFERVGAVENKRRILALHVVAIEGVRDQTIWTSRDGDLFFERHRRLTLQNVAMPHLDERAVAEESQILRARALRIIFVGRRIRNVELHFDRARCDR